MASAVGLVAVAIAVIVLRGPEEGRFSFSLFMLGALSSACFGVLCYISLALRISPRSNSYVPFPKMLQNLHDTITSDLIDEDNAKAANSKKNKASPPVFSRHIDKEIDGLVDQILENHVSSWLDPLVSQPRLAKNDQMEDANDEAEEVKNMIRDVVWFALKGLNDRLSKVDKVHFLASDVVAKVTEHFEKIRITTTASAAASESSGTGAGGSGSASAETPAAEFPIYQFLEDPKKEVEFLTKVADILIYFLLPSSYSKCHLTRRALREIVSRKVLFQMIDYIADPVNINTSILSWVLWSTSTTASGSSQSRSGGGKDISSSNDAIASTFFDETHRIKMDTLRNANSYQDFLNALLVSADVNALRCLRFNILSEIVQATTIKDLRAAKGGKEVSDDEDQAKLENYIGQLVRAKCVCETRLQELGCDPFARDLDHQPQPPQPAPAGLNMADQIKSLSSELPMYRSATTDTVDAAPSASFSLMSSRSKDLTFMSIMNSPFTRRYFYKFLEETQDGKQDLLGFWAAVEELRSADRTLWHQLATEIFYAYINKPSPVVLVNRGSLKRIESFLVGDTGPEIFYEIQEQVTEILETKYYPAFLISELCYKMLENMPHGHDNLRLVGQGTVATGVSELEPLKKEAAGSAGVGGGERKTSTAPPIEAKLFAKSQLEHIGEKLQNKNQALAALKSSLKPDSKVLKMLAGEVESLQEKRLKIQRHLERTDLWADHLGEWRCHVQSVDYIESEDCLQAVLIVHIPMSRDDLGRRRSSGGRPTSQKNKSWVCFRNVDEFHDLHKELMPYFSWIKGMPLPSAGGNSGGVNPAKSLMNFGGRASTNSTQAQRSKEKTRSILQKYIDAVLLDEKLNQSEKIYSFLSPSPDYLKSRRLNSKPNNKESGGVDDEDEIDGAAASANTGSSKSSSSSNEPKFNFGINLFKRGDQMAADGDGDGHHNNLLDDVIHKSELNDVGEPEHVTDSQDGIAEPFYALIGELFDVRGIFKIVRKSLMTFVQITYGSTINRHIKDTVTWLTSEKLIMRYLRSLRQASFSASNSKEEEEDETAGEKGAETNEELQARVRAVVLKNIPEGIIQLVGLQAAKSGTIKVLNTIQVKTLNKVLAYDLIELLSYALFPELVKCYAFQHFKNMSV